MIEIETCFAVDELSLITTGVVPVAALTAPMITNVVVSRFALSSLADTSEEFGSVAIVYVGVPPLMTTFCVSPDPTCTEFLLTLHVVLPGDGVFVDSSFEQPIKKQTVQITRSRFFIPSYSPSVVHNCLEVEMNHQIEFVVLCIVRTLCQNAI